MDRVLNPKDEKQTIYEIYRACRLCGAGAGYKMPIIQNVVELDGDGVELRQKIKECVQIEVNHTDRMPPLICELCVDKVNDFYEFLDMCKQNNRRTRLRLGLPLHTPTRDSVDSENCILGVTEPVFIDSDAEPGNRHKSKKNKVKKEAVEVKIKIESRPSPIPEQPRPTQFVEQSRSTQPQEVRYSVLSRAKPSPGPRSAKRPTRQSLDPVITPTEKPSVQPGAVSAISGGPSVVPRKPGPKRATRQANEPVVTPQEDVLLLERKLKRAREKETQIETPPPPPKKAKTIPEPQKIPVSKQPKIAQKEPPKTQKPQPKSKERKTSPPPKITSKPPPAKPLPSKVQTSKALPAKSSKVKVVEPPKMFACQICNVQTKTNHGLVQHQSTKHVPAFTNPKNACNACELWFLTAEEAVAHHKHHRTQNEPYKCTRCYGYFKLQLAYEEHFGLGQCLSEWEVPDARCSVCWRTFPTVRLLEEHRCAGEDARPGGKCVKCRRVYSLLKNLVKHESTCTYKRKGDVKEPAELRPGLLPMQVRVARCDPLLVSGTPVSCGALPQKYGLDSSCRYPYFRARVKTEPLPMVAIDETIKREYASNVDTLSALCLRTVQAKKLLKTEPDEFDDISSKINSILDHLASEDTQNSCDSDSILNIEKKAGDAKKEGTGVNDSVLNEKVGDAKTEDTNVKTTTSCEDDSILNEKKAGDAKKEGISANDSILNEKKDGDAKKEDTNVKTQTSCEDDSILNEKKADDTKTEGTSVNESILNEKKDGDAKKEGTSVNDSILNEKEDGDAKKEGTSVNDSVFNEKNGDAKTEDASVKIPISSEDDGILNEKKDDRTEAASVNSDLVHENGEAGKDIDTSKDSEGCVDSLKDTDSEEVKLVVNESNVMGDGSVKGIELVLNEPSIVNNDDDENASGSSNHDVTVSANHDDTNNLNNVNEADSLNHDEVIDRLVDRDDGEIANTENEQSKAQNENTDKELEITVNSSLTEDFMSKNDNVDSNIEFSKSENEINHHDNQDEAMEVDENNDDNDETYKPYNNENFSKIDEITNKILEEIESKVCDSQVNQSDHNSDSRPSENGVDSQDKFNVNDLSEDDRKLMAELDEQIGENEQKIDDDQRLSENDQRVCENDQRVYNDQRISENDQKISENDQRVYDNDQRISEYDHRISENDQRMNENDHRSSQNEQRINYNDQRTSEIDQRINENQRITENNQNSKNYYIDELIKKQDSDMRSLDLDNISDDEFNFDI